MFEKVHGLRFTAILIAVLFVMILGGELFAESVFLKDGSIVEGKITKENDKAVTLQNPDKTTRIIERTKIIRVAYDNGYTKKVYIKLKSGKVHEGYIVSEDSTQYTLRERLDSPAEFQIDKEEVVAVSGEKYISKGMYYALGIFPGAAQFYAKKDIEGTIFLGTALASFGFAGYCYYDYGKKKDDYHAVKRGAAASVFDKKYDDYKKSSQFLLGSLGLAGLVYIANWVDVIFFAAPEFGTSQDESKPVAYFDMNFGPSVVMSDPYCVGSRFSDSVTNDDLCLTVKAGVRF